MASQSGVRRDILSQLSGRGRVGGKNPISTLCSALDLKTVTDKAMVEAAVRELEQAGHVSVKRTPDGRTAEIIHLAPRRHVDRTEMSPQQKREAMFAKGVPARMPDSMCTPVTVRHLKEEAYQAGAPYHQNLTTCLQALREKADSEGVGADLSVRAVLLRISGMNNSRVSRALDHLRGMGLYTTQMTAYQQSTYVVALEPDVITDEMVKAYRAKVKPGLSKSSDNAIDTNDDTVQAVDQIEAQLADIIEKLEARVSEVETELAAANDRLQSVNEQRDRVSEENAALREQIVELQQQLDKSNRAIDLRVEGILKRHQSS